MRRLTDRFIIALVLSITADSLWSFGKGKKLGKKEGEKSWGKKRGSGIE